MQHQGFQWLASSVYFSQGSEKPCKLFMKWRKFFLRVAGFAWEFSRVYLDGMSLSKAVASSTVTVIVSIDAFQPLHLLHNLHCVLLNQGFVGEHILLLSAAVQVCACQDVGNCSESGEKFVWFASILRLCLATCGTAWQWIGWQRWRRRRTREQFQLAQGASTLWWQWSGEE